MRTSDAKLNGDATGRFKQRGNYYNTYRPSYPYDIITTIRNDGIFKNTSVVADIGSGTGISSKLFLTSENTVYGVEPNAEMRSIAEATFANDKNFISINGKAESTGLTDHSVDLVSAAQAMHWFDLKATKAEFSRILRDEGHVVLVWNIRKSGGTRFLEEFETLLKKYAVDYAQVRYKNIRNGKTSEAGIAEEVIEDFFAPKVCKIARFNNFQLFDLDGFKGRLLSSSYAPLPENPIYNDMIRELEEIFFKNKEDGRVKFEYDTRMYYC